MCLRVNKSEVARVPEEDAIEGANSWADGGVLAMREPPGYLGTIVRRMKLHAGAGPMEAAETA
jgi:hypothetical protein